MFCIYGHAFLCRVLQIKGTFLYYYTGFLLKHEAEILSQSEEEEHRSRWSLRVINWALILVREGRDRDYFENPADATRLLDPIIAFKKSCSVVLKYQITAIPLSFVQVSACVIFPKFLYFYHIEFQKDITKYVFVFPKRWRANGWPNCID